MTKPVPACGDHAPWPSRPAGPHEFDAACGAVFGMRTHLDEHTDGDIVRAVVRELGYPKPIEAS